MHVLPVNSILILIHWIFHIFFKIVLTTWRCWRLQDLITLYVYHFGGLFTKTKILKKDIELYWFLLKSTLFWQNAWCWIKFSLKEIYRLICFFFGAQCETRTSKHWNKCWFLKMLACLAIRAQFYGWTLCFRILCIEWFK